MPQTKAQKAAAIEEIVAMLDASPTLYLTDYQGLTVQQADALRTRFREAGVDFKVLKNTLLRLAMQQKGGYDELFDQLNGPTAVAFSEEPATPARVIKKFTDEEDLELPQLKGAYVDGAVYGAGTLDVLSSLKSKADILADVLALLLAPATNLASAIGAPGQELAGALAQPGSALAGAIQQIAQREA